MSRAVQRRATKVTNRHGEQVTYLLRPTNLQRDERRFREFASFLRDMVKELNDISSEGGAVLVEGKRDAAALKGLGYSGPIFSVSILTSSDAARQKLRNEISQMVILTDLDTEGRRLASRYVKFLAREGVKSSLAQRKRLSAASHGIFLHFENLIRFASDGKQPSSGVMELLYPGTPRHRVGE
jgi:5S rRNA maturation endonuclease (ribonuclease M5)